MLDMLPRLDVPIEEVRCVWVLRLLDLTREAWDGWSGWPDTVDLQGRDDAVPEPFLTRLPFVVI